MSVQPIPEAFHTITPFLCVDDVPRVIEFLKSAFGATERMRLTGAEGRVMHAQVQIGDSILMMGEATGACPAMPASCYLYVPDADATYHAAIKAGAESLMAPANQFWGDRMSSVRDFAGNQWSIATHVEDLSPDDIAGRAPAGCTSA